MGKIIILAEKPDIGTRLAAVLGGCYIDGVLLAPDMLSDKKYEGKIKRQRFEDGCLKAKFRGKECIITWGFGHMAELKQAYDYDARYKGWREDLFPFVPEDYEIKAKKAPGVAKQLSLIRKLFNDRDTEYIINATDADREGELIFEYVYRLSNCKKPYKRLWINSQTEEAIDKGFKNLKTSKEMEPLQEAGKCRAIADWLVGANLTAMSTLKFGGYKNMISVGRVQTPTLSILVNREKEILDFKSKNFYELVGRFLTKDGKSYEGKWKKGSNERFDSKKAAENLVSKLKGKLGTISRYSEISSKEKPPLLYDLTALQMMANSRYKFSAKKTLQIAQELYENQFLTYPRTDSRYLGEDVKVDIPDLILAIDNKYEKEKKIVLGERLVYSSRFFNNSKVSSHHAIVTTKKSPKGLSGDQKKIYDMVAESLLMAFMADAEWMNIKLETEVAGETFYSSSKILIEEGWRILVKKKETKENSLPRAKKGDMVENLGYEVLAKKTKAPPRYTEKTLLSSMETAGRFVEDEELKEAMKARGLGTPATRADIIEKLVKIGYVEKERGVLIPTNKGVEIIERLPIESIKSPSLTGEWEYKLSTIESGKEKPEVFIKEIEEYVTSTVKALKGFEGAPIQNESSSLGKCPNCGSDVVQNKKGYGCSGWRSGCKFQLWNSPICGKKLTKANAKQLLTKGETNLIKGFYSEKKKKNFDAKLELIKGENGKLKFKFC